MPSITLKYTDSGGTSYTNLYSALYVKGFDAVDEVELFGVRNDYLDGSADEQVAGFFRKFEVGLPANLSQVDRKFVLDWFRSNIKYLTAFTHDGITENDVQVVNEANTLVAAWLFGTDIARSVTIRVREKLLRTSYPTASSYSTTITMYRKKRLQITGTKAAPQTLTTNAGMLILDEDGASWPAFTNLVKVSVEVSGSPYQERKVFLANTPSLSGTNVTFQVAMDDVGDMNPADGLAYADIRIFVNP